MNGEAEAIRERAVQVLGEAAPLCYAVRDSDLQREMIESLDKLRVEAEQAKASCAEAEPESANALLAVESLLGAAAHELALWIAIKEGRASDAWEHLVGAEDAIRIAMAAHEIGRGSDVERYQLKLAAIEELIFPPQLFLSMGGTAKRQICSLCGSVYGECDHLAGRVYAGKVCAREISEMELEEVSFVRDPANRRCRVMAISDGGVRRDALTLRPLAED